MFEILRSKDGGYYWHLNASNGEKICHSEIYTTKQAAQGGLEAVRRIVPTASVHDRT